MIGNTLSHFEITARLGAGGMGEVWRATDTRLGREVALKMLPEEFARNPERMERLEREAKVLASLNHPNIAQLYGLETAVAPPSSPPLHDHPVNGEYREDGRQIVFLVMELIEGEDLADRIARGPIPMAEAIPIALQIAEALEVAHGRSIVHRDLKPGNIKLTGDDTVKVLDFGLARTPDSDGGDSSLSMSPTVTGHATADGMILGTAPYMSPEQARGKKVDRRADIWAFGVVMWEMLTGQRLFAGETVSDILAAVLRADPDWEELPADTPSALRRLLERCLTRDPRSRLRDAGDARLELEAADRERREDKVVGQLPAGGRGPRWWLPWLLVAVSAAIAVLSPTVLRRSPAGARRVVASILLPTGAASGLGPEYEGSLAVSPDGQLLVFSAALKDDTPRLWVRPLDSKDAAVLPGTENGFYPFWSPDGRWIAFFANEKLKKVSLTGSPPQVICEAPTGRPGSWNDRDEIIFSPTVISGVYRVPASGGKPQAMTRLDESRGETTHRWASFLPDGRRFLYLAGGHDLSRDAKANALYVGDLQSGLRRRLMPLRSAAAFDSGHLLYVRDGVLVARRFDAGSLAFTGDPVSVAEDVAYDPAFFQGRFAVGGGTVAYRDGTQLPGTRLAWYDRNGRGLQKGGQPLLARLGPVPRRLVDNTPAALSPDDSRFMCMLENERTGAFELWIAELNRGTWTRFSRGPLSEGFPVWSPAGDRVAFSRTRPDRREYDLFVRDVDGSGTEKRLLTSDATLYPTGWSSDGRFLLYVEMPSIGAQRGGDLWVLPMEGAQKPLPFVKTEHSEPGGKFSPDGRWVLYISDESGSAEAYIKPFPGPGASRQVSTNGAFWGWWQTPSEVLLAVPDGTMAVVEVSVSGRRLQIGASRTLPKIGSIVGGEPSHDGRRFLAAVVAGERVVPRCTLIIDWAHKFDG